MDCRGRLPAQAGSPAEQTLRQGREFLWEVVPRSIWEGGRQAGKRKKSTAWGAAMSRGPLWATGAQAPRGRPEGRAERASERPGSRDICPLTPITHRWRTAPGVTTFLALLTHPVWGLSSPPRPPEGLRQRKERSQRHIREPSPEPSRGDHATCAPLTASATASGGNYYLHIYKSFGKHSIHSP